MYLSKSTILLLGLSLVILLLWKCNNANPDNIGTVDTTRWTNKAGKEVVSLKGTEQAFGMRDKHIADSLARVYGLRVKQLQEYIIVLQHARVDLQPSGPVAKDYFPPDSSNCPPAIKDMRQSFANPYYNADVQIGDSSYMHLERHDTLTAIWRRGKNYLQLDLSSADTSNHIEGVKAYRHYVPPKRWGIGVVAGYGVAIEKPTNPVPFIGIGISYSIIKF